jgi:simple sugar transport system permease protein
VAAIGIVALGLALLGQRPGPALAAMLRGSFGDADAVVTTLLKASPLLLTGTAVALSFRCGVWNIGAEGQLVTGAVLATAMATRIAPDAPAFVLLPLCVAAGAAGGAALAALAGLLRVKRGVSEVIATLLLNFVALQALALAVHGPLQETSAAYPQSDALPAAALLPAAGRLHLGVALAGAMAVATAWLLFRTPAGFRLRAVGLSPVAARFAGLSPEREVMHALVLAGALAGIAGAFEVMGVTRRLFEGLASGAGYTAIAVALLARLHPLAVLPAALFFGALEAGAGAMQRNAGVPSVVTQVVQGLVILLSLGFGAGEVRLLAGRARSRPLAGEPAAREP